MHEVYCYDLSSIIFNYGTSADPINYSAHTISKDCVNSFPFVAAMLIHWQMWGRKLWDEISMLNSFHSTSSVLEKLYDESEFLLQPSSA